MKRGGIFFKFRFKFKSKSKFKFKEERGWNLLWTGGGGRVEVMLSLP